MVELCVMASAALAPAVFPCEQRLCRVKKEHQALVSFQGKRQEIPKNAFLYLQAHHLEEQERSVHILPDYELILSPINPVFIDVQDSLQDCILFSFGISEQCTRHEKILKYLLLGSNLTEGPSLSFLPDLTGFQTVPIDMNHYPYVLDGELPYNIGIQESRAFLNLENQSSLPSSLLNFFGNVSKSLLLSIDPSGRILFSGSGAEMKDLLSILSEFNLYKKSSSGSKASLLVPFFERNRIRGRGGNNVSVLKFPTDTVAPLKSPMKSSTKRKQNKSTIKNRDIFQKNYFHAFESLLSMLLDKKRNGTSSDTDTAILLLKQSGPKIAHILTQFSIGIAGTGLAVLLSVACKMAGPRVPLCAARVFTTSFGFGLFWLSSAVNGLGETILQIFKISNKIKLKDEEIMCKVERSMRDVVFRAGALVALAVLRFA